MDIEFIKNADTTEEEINAFFDRYRNHYIQLVKENTGKPKALEQVMTNFFIGAIKAGFTISEIFPVLCSDEKSVINQTLSCMTTELLEYIKRLQMTKLYAMAGIDIRRDNYVDWSINLFLDKSQISETLWNFCLYWRKTEAEERKLDHFDMPTIESELLKTSSDSILRLFGAAADRNDYPQITDRAMIYPYSTGAMILRFDQQENLNNIEYC